MSLSSLPYISFLWMCFLILIRYLPISVSLFCCCCLFYPFLLSFPCQKPLIAGHNIRIHTRFSQTDCLRCTHNEFRFSTRLVPSHSLLHYFLSIFSLFLFRCLPFFLSLSFSFGLFEFPSSNLTSSFFFNLYNCLPFYLSFKFLFLTPVSSLYLIRFLCFFQSSYTVGRASILLLLLLLLLLLPKLRLLACPNQQHGIGSSDIGTHRTQENIRPPHARTHKAHVYIRTLYACV